MFSFSPETNCRNLLEVAATAACSPFPEETHTQTLTPSIPHIFFLAQVIYSCATKTFNRESADLNLTLLRSCGTQFARFVDH